jgi:hypothetical protein
MMVPLFQFLPPPYPSPCMGEGTCSFLLKGGRLGWGCDLNVFSLNTEGA